MERFLKQFDFKRTLDSKITQHDTLKGQNAFTGVAEKNISHHMIFRENFNVKTISNYE